MKKSNIVKKGNIILWLLTILVAICGVTVAIITDLIEESHTEYFSAELWQKILIFVLAIFISILLHEIAHAIVFKMQGVDIRILYIFPFCIIREESKLKVCIGANCQIGIGGLVIPKLPIFNNKKDIDDFLKKSRIATLSGPLFSAVMGITSTLLAYFTTDYLDYDMRSYYFIFLFAMILCSVYINFMSMLNIGGAAGDYYSAKEYRLKNNMAYLLLYSIFTLQNKTIKKNIREKNTYFIETIKQRVEKISIDDLKNNPILFLFANALLYEMILSKKEFQWDILEETKLDIIFSYYQKVLKFECYSIFFSHVVMYLYLSGKTDESIKLWEKYKENMLSNKKSTKYRVRQVERLIYKKEIDSKKIEEKLKIELKDSLLSKLENYYDDEININKIIESHIK